MEQTGRGKYVQVAAGDGVGKSFNIITNVTFD